MFNMTASKEIAIQYFDGNIANVPHASTAQLGYHKAGLSLLSFF